jgi:sugar diacid utilization regulator
VWWERLGGLALLADRLDHADLAELPDVRALDRLAAGPHGGDTVAVLDAICATGSARKAAAALHRHHSTMPARLAHAESVLGFALDAPADRFRLRLALLLRRLRDNTA